MLNWYFKSDDLVFLLGITIGRGGGGYFLFWVLLFGCGFFSVYLFDFPNKTYLEIVVSVTWQSSCVTHD